ncbi:Alpha/Beta hydrolase protein [Halenospora varia]|nr:Alpha/Beta hydrolase protein [Halenospora varia]
MSPIRPYTIRVSQTEVDKLNQKLALSEFPNELEDAGRNYGAPLGEVKRLVTFWKDVFKWSVVEKEMNKLPNFETTIDVDGFGPLDIHFLHEVSSVKTAIPLLFVHGWPGSFLEVTRLLPFLQESAKNHGPAFHVVAISLPNFAFSSGVTKRGFGLQHYAEVCHKLMLVLGYYEYVTCGTDIGSSITRLMSKLYPSSLKALYTNLVPALPPSPWSLNPFPFLSFLARHILNLYTPAEKAGLEYTRYFQKEGMGYYNLQTTKPQTVSYALVDSPVGFLAWMWEKMHDWTDGYVWSDEEVCTWVSLYWFSRAGVESGLRLYYESTRGDEPARAGGYIPHTKLGLAYFPREMFRLPKAWGHGLGNVVYEKEHKKGGHFAAWEVPEAVAGDLIAMFGKDGGAYGCVKGNAGYASQPS